jgi:hypothetical protein
LFPRRCWVTTARKQAAWSLTQVEKAALFVESPAQPHVLTPLTHCYRAKPLEKSRRALGSEGSLNMSDSLFNESSSRFSKFPNDNS